ncbi:hypothetical protein BG844_24000 [Couchioplanes caeruleus subsp. caeruleus]|uniref:Bacterial transcriptional activator domain-containing protein n=1 Tax=Couchioplanes caeruleus subsp. caeruleus TaxID=56427 RepID=A0A1K0FG77_9ACTN|nr:hypothetical protein BG844_24000 [Couchioplanes caeruleus subsp. caeruleus]
MQAAAGYGKTTAVRRWLDESAARWLSGAALTTGARGTVPDGTTTIVDDVHLAQPGVLLPALGEQSRLVVIGRCPPPAAALPTDAIPARVGPVGLAMDAGGTAGLLDRSYGVTGADLAEQVYRFTFGWPTLVHLVGAALATDPALTAMVSGDRLLAALAGPGSTILGFLTEQVFAGLDPATRRLLADAAQVESISVELARTLGHRRAGDAIDHLTRLGLLASPGPAPGQLPKPGPAPTDGEHHVVPLVAAAARGHLSRPATRQRVLAAAAGWYRTRNRPAEALRLAATAGDDAGCATLLAEHGGALLFSGAAARVVAVASRLPAGVRDEHTDLLLAEALETTGDPRAALAVYASLAVDLHRRLRPALAWRYGAATYMWRDPRDALRVFSRGALTDEDTADEALLLGWTAAAHWLTGDEPQCRSYAERAHRSAVACGDERARANAYVALALCANLAADPAALMAHYQRALRLAEGVGDTVLVTRIRANMAAGLERQGRHAEALEVLVPATCLAERNGHVGMLAMALCNEGMLLRRLGRLDEAASRLIRSIELYQHMDSRKVTYPLSGLADVHRQRGRLGEAEALYREAMRAASGEANRQGMVPALAGLALVVAADRPAEATDLCREALRHASGSQVPTAHLAAGTIAVRAGDLAEALRHARAAAEAAGRQRDRPGLAEALELQSTATADPAEASRALTEALAIWQETHASVEIDRVRITLGQLPGAGTEQRASARLAAGRLRAAGVTPTPPARPGPAAPAQVEIRTLGGFSVLVGGDPVPPAAWPSQKARDLLRVLVARRGRPVPRDELAELLWGNGPGGQSERISHRLSVALSTVRSVLDPGRCVSPHHFIAASQANITLNLDRLTVDVEEFLTTAQQGLRLSEYDRHADAYAVLAEAERCFSGEVFAGEPYDDWARALREEARATYLHVLRALAVLARRDHDVDDAVRYLLRLLAIDQYDEQSHQSLIAVLARAGHFGEAARAQQHYAEAMREIGITATEIIGPALRDRRRSPTADSAL